MTTQADHHTQLRILLADTGETVWTDSEIDNALNEALADLSRYTATETTASVATVADDRDLDISALTTRIRVQAVELPTGNWPRTLRRFAIFGDTLTIMDDPAPDGTNATVYYDAFHNFTGSGSLPIQFDPILRLGAAWKACEMRAANTTNAVNDGGPQTPGEWAGHARNYRLRYETQRNPLPGVRVGSLHAPDKPVSRSQSTDPGP